MSETVQRLTPLEIDVLSAYGIRRFSDAMSGGVGGNRVPRNFDYLVNSAMAEYVVARALGVFFDFNNVLKSDIYIHDIGAKIEVRHSKTGDAHLTVGQKDRDDAYFVLVTGSAPDFEIVGVTSGAAAKRQQFWRPDYQAFWVPQDVLHPFEALKGRIQQARMVQTAQ